MFVLPFLAIVALGFAAFALTRRRAQVAPTGGGASIAASEPRTPFWPTSTYGRLGVGALALVFVTMALVNVVQVPFLQWFLVLAAGVLSGLARLGSHDRSASVLITFVVSALAALAALLFLFGEILTGHD